MGVNNVVERLVTFGPPKQVLLDNFEHLLGGRAGFEVNPDGTEAWTANLDDLAEQLVPTLHPDSDFEGPSTFNNAVPTITDSGVLTSVIVGYLTSLGALVSSTLSTLAPVFESLLPEGVTLMSPSGGLAFRPATSPRPTHQRRLSH